MRSIRLVSLLLGLVVLAGCGLPGFIFGGVTPSATQSVGAETAAEVSPPGSADERPVYPDPGVMPVGFVTAPVGAGLTGYLEQRITWRDCDGDQCANIVVPLDYANPGAQAITLSIRRKLAAEKLKLGTLFINPGGPGGSGVDLVQWFDTAGLEQYDIVGWDPRGVGESTPVTCFDGEQADAFVGLDGSPDSKTERIALIDASEKFGKSCWDHSGVLLEHISTEDTVRDLELLRELLGDDKLNYFGYSYGTFIGALYAEMFGPKVNRMVLDAAVDITGYADPAASRTTEDGKSFQAVGFDRALDNFASWCVARKCALGNTSDWVKRTITGLFDSLESTPLKVGERELTQTLAATGVVAGLYYDEQGWPKLLTAIRDALDGTGGALLRLADGLNGRQSDGTYGSGFYSFNAISCVDSDEGSVFEADQLWDEASDAAPVFGHYLGPIYTCARWPVPAAPQLTIMGRDAPPMVVIGGTGDSATPYEQAVTMAEQLVSAVLVTYEGSGHGAYGGKSSCIDSLVVDYLVHGKMPSDGTVCQK